VEGDKNIPGEGRGGGKRARAASSTKKQIGKDGKRTRRELLAKRGTIEKLLRLMMGQGVAVGKQEGELNGERTGGREP